MKNSFLQQFAQNINYCILTDKEPIRTFASRELISPKGKKYEKLYDCRKPVKQYYIYFQCHKL